MHSNAIAEVTAKFDRQLAGLKKREASSVVKEPDKANATYDVLLQVRSRRQG